MTATPSKKDNFESNVTATNIGGATWLAGYFTASSSYIATSIHLLAIYYNTPYTAIVSLKSTDANHYPTGADLAIGSILASSTGTNWNFDVPLTTPFNIVSGTEYAVVVRYPLGDTGWNFLYPERANDPIISINGGASWSGTGKLCFQIYGCIPPTVSTANAINLTVSSSTLQGTIDSMGDYSPVYVYFQYGLSDGYGAITAEQEKTVAESFSATVTGLTYGSTYHYRAVCRYA